MMKIFTFKKIKNRLTFWFLLVALVPLAFSLVISTFKAGEYMKETTYSKLIAIRDLKVERLEEWSEDIKTNLESISTNETVLVSEQKIGKKKPGPNDMISHKELRKLLQHYLVLYPSFDELFIISSISGKVICSTDLDDEGIKYSDEDFFTKPLQTRKIFVQDIFYLETKRKITMIYSIPLFCLEHDGEHATGVLAAVVNLKHSLYPILNDRVGLGKTGETLIVNDKGVALSELRWFENAPLKLQISAEPAQNAVLRNTGIIFAKDYRGEEVLASYTFIPRNNWGFICKQDIHELNEPNREMILNYIIIFLVAVLLTVFFASFIARLISKPIVDLTNMSQKIKNGNYSERNNVISEDEIGSLAKSVNEMTDSIESKSTFLNGVEEISATIIGQKSIREFGSEVIKKLMDITGSCMSVFYVKNESTSNFDHLVSIGANEELLRPFNFNNLQGELGVAISKKRINFFRDLPKDTIFKFQASAGDIIPREIITIPIIVEEVVLAIISLIGIQKFSAECYAIIDHSWQSINTKYSSIVSDENNRKLAENLKQVNQNLKAQTKELQYASGKLEKQIVELDMQRIQVEEANRLKSEFLSNMSHELRTPLNSIMALSRVLVLQLNDKLSDEENKYLKIIERNGMQLLELINDILDLAKIEAGKVDVSLEQVSLAGSLNKIKQNLAPLAVAKGITLNLDVPEDIPRIETDEAKLSQVFNNIISNAIKFTEKGRVEISVKQNSSHLLVDVKDTGVGISHDDIAHIFDEFRQVDGSLSRRFDGTGLGLAIAMKIIKILGGNIEVKSIFSEGSIFTISIPIIFNRETNITDALVPKRMKSSFDGKTILVVDDDLHIVNEMSGYLKSVGYNPIGTTSGKKAISIAEKYHPFAITLDVFMPEQDGWEVLQNLKGNKKTKNIPVIIVSVSEDEGTGYALGAVGFVKKPLDKYIILGELEKLRKRPHTIMIVDDSEIDRKNLSEILAEENMQVIEAENGTECLHLIKKQIPDLIVLDLIMPGLDGFQILDQIRKGPLTRELPVIISTAKDLSNKDQLKIRGKVSSVISKSDVSRQDLFVEISRILNELEGYGETPLRGKVKSEICLLLVEATESVVIEVKSALHEEGYKIEVAGDEQEAFDFIKKTVPDGIILDLNSQKIAGFEMIEKIRSHKATKNLPVLIIAAKKLSQTTLSRLDASYFQQLIYKGNVDKNDLIYKIDQMFEFEPQFKKNDIGRNEKTVKNLVQKKEEKSASEIEWPKILVIEDNPDNMTVVNAILKNKYNIIEAWDGEEGLKKVIEDVPDIILLDMALPKMDGIEVVKILKKSPLTKNIPVIAMTARAMKTDKELILKSGCDDFLAKPYKVEKLLGLLEKWHAYRAVI